MDIQRVFSESINRNYPKYFANFPPNTPIKIGDYGFLRNDSFHRVGNLESEYGVKINGLVTGNHSDMEYKSKSGVSVDISSNGDINASGLNAKVNMRINFSKAKSVFFKAIGCEITSIENGSEFEKQILNLLESNNWKYDFVIVTSSIKCKKLNLIISNTDNASINIEAESNDPNFNILNADTNCKIVSEIGLANKFISEEGTIPLLSLSAIRRKYGIIGPHEVKIKFAVPGEDNNNSSEFSEDLEFSKMENIPIHNKFKLYELNSDKNHI